MFFAGLASGYNKAMTEDRHLQAQQDEARAARENAALQHLATSDDPEIASMALTGLLNQSRKPSKGLRGFFNETEGNPMLPTIRQLMAQGKQVPKEPAPSQLPEGSSAAMPAGSPTEPGGPPLSLGAVHNQLPQAPGETATVPRQAFLSPVDRARALETAKLSGKYRAELDAYAQAAGTPGALSHARWCRRPSKRP